MSCFEVISLIIYGLVALGTISLAIFSFTQVRRVKREYEIRQLNDILAWANSLIGWKFAISARVMPSMNADQLYRNYANLLSNDERLLSVILRQGTLTSNIALALKKRLLFIKIGELCKEISTMLQELKSVINDVTPIPGMIYGGFEPPDLSKLEEQKRKQDALAKELISLVSDIISTY